MQHAEDLFLSPWSLFTPSETHGRAWMRDAAVDVGCSCGVSISLPLQLVGKTLGTPPKKWETLRDAAPARGRPQWRGGGPGGRYRPPAALPTPLPLRGGRPRAGVRLCSDISYPKQSGEFYPHLPNIRFLFSPSPPSSSPSHGTVLASATLRGTVGVGVSPHAPPPHTDTSCNRSFLGGFEALGCV